MRNLPLGRLVFVASFVLFSSCAARGLYLRDSGELSTAAYTLGVAHETGFALWCLLTKALTLLPLGEVATRCNLGSALAAALAAALVFRLVRTLGNPDGQGVAEAEPAATLAGLGAAGLVVAGLTVFRAATVAEVYASAAALLAACIGWWTLAARGDRRAGLLLAFAGGLSLGLHAQVRLLVGPAACLMALWRLRRGDRWPLVAPFAVALGGLVVTYLPLRAARSPAANWANPRTLAGVTSHLMAARIRRAFAGEMFHDVGHHVLVFARQTEGELGLVALLLALVGLAWLWAAPQRRALGVILTIVLGSDVFYSAAVNPMALDDLQVGHPTALVLAVAAGAGILAAARKLGRAAPWAAGALAVGLCVPAALADSDGKTGLDDEASTWAGAALTEAPPRALILAESDDLAAGCAYEQWVAGARPDVTLLVRQLLWDGDDVAHRVRLGGREVRPESRLRKLIEEALPQRAVLWEPGQDASPLPLEPDVPLDHVRATLPPLPPARPLAERVEQLLGPARDPTVRRLWATQLTALGRLFLQRGDTPRAAALFETARAVRPTDAVAAIDLAVVRARAGDFTGALALVDDVLTREPDRTQARLNAGRYRLRLGDLGGARREFERVHARHPDDASALMGLARTALASGDRAGARQWLHQAQQSGGDDAELARLAKELER